MTLTGKAIIRTLLYFDIFSHPLSKSELFGMLGIKVDTAEFEKSLSELQDLNLVGYGSGYYFLVNGSSSIEERVSKQSRSLKYQRISRIVSSLIYYHPFVKGILISGSLAKSSFSKKDDIDFFIIADPGRIWLCRVFLMMFKKIFLLNSKKYFCINYFIDSNSLYLRMQRASFLVGMVGLNELVQTHAGQELHQSKQAFKFGLKVIAHMKLLVEKFSQRYGMRFVLEQTPAESTAYRFAKLDLKYHSPKSGHIVKGDISKGEVYYTNSTYLNNSAVLNPIERVRQEGLFHPLIEAAALTHIWLGEARPSKASLANFVIKTFRLTQNDQIAFSPEFTTCNSCNRTSRGLRPSCAYCGSEDVDGITRITGYFTKISSWNKGKIGELQNRYRNHDFMKENDDGVALEIGE